MAGTELCHDNPMEIGALVDFTQPGQGRPISSGIIVGPATLTPDDGHRCWAYPIKWDDLEEISVTPLNYIKFTGYRRR